jgi:hypothetical protein
MDRRADIEVVVPESVLQWAEPMRYVCLGLAVALVVLAVVLIIRSRRRLKMPKG